MECAECKRLANERNHREALFEKAAANIEAASPRSSFTRYMALRKLADEAERDLELIKTMILRHQDSHATGQHA